MRKLLTALVATVCAATAGCGSAPKSPDATRTLGERDLACAAGKGDLEIADVLPRPPAGMEIVEADPEATEPVVEPLRQALGDRLRDIETRVVVPKGQTFGTGFVLATANEGSGPPGEVVRAARDAAEKNPELEYEEITVAGAPAVLVSHPNGDVQIHTPLGDCATGFLYDDDRERLLGVAKALRVP